MSLKLLSQLGADTRYREGQLVSLGDIWRLKEAFVRLSLALESMMLRLPFRYDLHF